MGNLEQIRIRKMQLSNTPLVVSRFPQTGRHFRLRRPRSRGAVCNFGQFTVRYYVYTRIRERVTKSKLPEKFISVSEICQNNLI